MKNLFTFRLYNLSRPLSDAKVRRISESTYTITFFFAYFWVQTFALVRCESNFNALQENNLTIADTL